MKKIIILLLLALNIYSSDKNIYLYCPNWGNIFSDYQFYVDGDLASSNYDQIKKPFYDLRNNCIKLGYNYQQISSIDNLNENNFLCLICYDIHPDEVHKLKNVTKEKLILYIWEPPTVCAYNYDRNIHKYFSKVYTVLDDLIDNKKYFKYFTPQPSLKYCGDSIPFEQKKLCCLFSGNKVSAHPDELYSKRREVINYFEKNQTNDFDFYGIGWDRKVYKNFKGFVLDGIEARKKYRFCICYENIRDLNGYITEKLFYCLFAGCVPVYWGPKNIYQYIPENCIIPGWKYQNPDDLYKKLKSITKSEYENYIKNIKAYLKTFDAFKFSSENFTDIFCQNLADYKREKIFNEDQILLLEKTTKLHKAIEKNDINTIKNLIQNGINVNDKDGNGTTPLMFASYFNYLEIVKILLAKGADLKLKNNLGYDALHYAKLNNSSLIIKMLEKK